MTDPVKDYFDLIAEEFDSIYDEKKSGFSDLINNLFRGSMFERVEITVKDCINSNISNVLDVGCGSGRISYILAKNGINVTGIDYSESMIQLAKKKFAKEETKGKMEFLCCDFIKEFEFDKKFDVSIALGVFDYTQDPTQVLTRMKESAKKKIIASFPAKYSFQTPLRKIWLYKRKCPVFFYTERDIIAFFRKIDINQINIKKTPTNAKIPTGFLVIAEV